MGDNQKLPHVDNKTTSHVTVACKIGVAWFDLQLCKEQQVMENTQTGPRSIKQWVREGEIIRIRGTAYPRGEVPEGFPDKPQMVAGYALTHGVPREFWENWLKQQAKAPYVKSGMIMAFASADDIKAAAGEHKGELSGLEPIQRDKKSITDPRVVKSTEKAVTSIEPAERAAA